MRSRPLGFTFVLAAAVALASCSAGDRGTAFGADFLSSALQRDAGESATAKVVYSCQAVDSICDVLNPNGKILKTLTSANGLNGPEGTSVDPSGNWYIANANAGNILKFSAKGAALLSTLDDSGAQPIDVAVAGKTVAVANLSGPNSLSASVSVYLNGGTTAARTLTDSAAAEGVGVAFDSKGNCYWSFKLANTHGQIDEFTGCNGAPQNLGITTGLAGGLAFDGKDNLFYVDRTVGVYSCSGVTSCGARFTGFSQPFDINFDKRWKNLWVSDIAAANIREIDIATGSVVRSFGFEPSDPPFGVAAAPGPK